MINKKGYTLIELIIVLALLGIIVNIGFTSTNYYKKLSEKRELDDLKKDIMFARNSAVVEGKNYIIEFNKDTNTYYIFTGAKKEVVRSKKFENGIKIDKNNDVTSFIFKANGTTGKSGSLKLRDDEGNRYKITVTPATGRIELRKINFK